MITFVIYHVPIPKETVKSSKVLLPFHRMGFNYERMLDLAFRSALLFHPECRIVLLTSLSYQPVFSPEISEKIETVRYDVDATQSMVERCWAESQYLQRHDFTSHVVMMDGDMLVNANLDGLFDHKFDIALTYGEGKTETGKKMPINGGLKLFASHNREAAIQFLNRVYELCNSEHLANYRTWWGDQYALIEAIGVEKFWDRTSDRIRTNGLTLQLLPCDIYNFTPCKKASGYMKKWNNKKMIHFRGVRKRYMHAYWNLFLEPHEKNNLVDKLSMYRERASLYLRAMLSLP